MRQGRQRRRPPAAHLGGQPRPRLARDVGAGSDGEPHQRCAWATLPKIGGGGGAVGRAARHLRLGPLLIAGIHGGERPCVERVRCEASLAVSGRRRSGRAAERRVGGPVPHLTGGGEAER